MIETDDEFKRWINRIDNRLSKVEWDLKLGKILTSSPIAIIIFIICIIHIAIFMNGVVNYFDNEFIFVITSIIEFYLTFLLIYYINESVENWISKKQEEQQIFEEQKELLMSFLAYITSCRHIEAIKNEKDIYPELRYSDSLHVYEEYKDIFEEQRIKYENGKRIQALFEIENIENFKQEYDKQS